MISPYKVKKLVKSFYYLELLHRMKIHNIFYPNLLQKVADDSLSGQRNSPPPPTVVDNKKEWEVDNILDDKHGKDNKVVFWVK